MKYVLVLVCAVGLQAQTVESAWKLVAQGQREQAVTMLRQIVKTDARNPDAHLLLGSLLMEAGEREDSIAQLKEGVKLRPNSAEAHNALGEAYQTFGDSKSAQPEFEKAIALDGKFAQGQVNLGAVLVQAGDGDAAEQHLDAAIRLLGTDPESAYPRYLRAKVYSARHETEKAIADLERAVALRPEFPEAWSDLGEARKAKLDDEGALQAFRKAVELNPEDAVSLTRLGSKLLETGKAHDAVAPLQHAVRLDPNDPTALNALQLALRKDGQREQADEIKQRLANLLRNKDKADQNLVAAIELNNKGSELEKKQDIKGALEKYKAALELSPDHVGIRTNLAVALLKLGQWSEGLSQMREALHRDPGNTLLQKALEDALAQAKSHGIAVR